MKRSGMIVGTLSLALTACGGSPTAVGVAAAAVGNHDFDFGVPALKERIAQLGGNLRVGGNRGGKIDAEDGSVGHGAEANVQCLCTIVK